MTKMEFVLSDLEDTRKFGEAMAETLLRQREKGKMPNAVYLLGEMGAGKTTFTRAFVGALPNAENAEVASPSFTICHEYPTEPQIYHADLYRLPDNIDLPEELQDLGSDVLLLIEWAERLRPEAKDGNRLEIFFSVENSSDAEKIASENIDNFGNLCEIKRHIKVLAHGEIALEFEQQLQKNLQNCLLLK